VTEDARLSALEARVEQLESMVELALRLLALEDPAATLLRRFNATEAEESAVRMLLEDTARSAERGGIYAPTFNGFVQELFERFPSARAQQEFVQLLLGTLKLDRQTYRNLHAYAAAHGWLQQS
jgi:hypothetical protein